MPKIHTTPTLPAFNALRNCWQSQLTVKLTCYIQLWLTCWQQEFTPWHQRPWQWLILLCSILVNLATTWRSVWSCAQTISMITVYPTHTCSCKRKFCGRPHLFNRLCDVYGNPGETDFTDFCVKRAEVNSRTNSAWFWLWAVAMSLELTRAPASRSNFTMSVMP